MLFRKKKKEKKDRYKSKYLDIDLESLSDAEFDKISKKVKTEVTVRCFGGILLFVVCIWLLILCDKQIW